VTAPLVHRTMASVPHAVPEARAAIDVLRERLLPDTFNDLRLMVSELVTNSLRHGKLQPSDLITLTVRAVDPALRVEVRNPGHGFAPPARDGSATAGGWGLVIVAELSTAWGVVDDGATCVWFEIPVDGNDA
jgi:anti-sigma regulatory factor (Ser/Thr protein kinase)